MKISNIKWLSKSAKEAEIKISDGKHEITVFCQPCDYLENKEVEELIHPMEVENFQKSFETEVKIMKLSTNYFGYKIVGIVYSLDDAIISVGELKFELNIPIPSWAEEGDLIEFESMRFDLW